MRKLLEYTATLIDFETWLPLPGVEQFEATYKPWQLSGRTFAFERDSAESRQAAADLHRAGIRFLTTCNLVLEPEEEAAYPAFWLAAPAEFDLVDFGQEPPRVPVNKLASGIAYDVHQEVHVLTSDFHAGLADFGVSLQPRAALTTKRQPVWLVDRFAELPEPFEVLYAESIVERTGAGAGTFEPQSWDMRVRLSPSNLDFLQQQHLGQCAQYTYQGQTYRNVGTAYLVSGTLAQWIRKQYGESIHLAPAILDTIWGN